jgi:hypothetical protein
MRHAYLGCLACVAILAAARAAGAGDAWMLDRHAWNDGTSCSLSRADRGRPFSVALAFLPDTTDQGVVSLTFDEPGLMEGAKKAVATLTFDNRKRRSHRIEVTPDGTLLVPIVSLKMPAFLQTLSETSKLTIATRHGSTSFNLDGIATHIADLRDCAGG